MNQRCILHIVISFIILIAAALVIYYYLHHTYSDTVDAILPNIASELIGIALVVLAIDYIKEAYLKKEIEKRRKMAYYALILPLQQFLELIFKIIKASSSTIACSIPNDITILGDNKYYEEIKNMNILSAAPVRQRINWMEYISQQIEVLITALDRILEIYGIHLQSSDVENIELFRNCAGLKTLMIQEQFIFQPTESGAVIPEHPLVVSKTLFDHDLDAIYEVYKICEKMTGVKLFINDAYYSDNVMPKYGSAMISRRNTAIAEGPRKDDLFNMSGE